MSRRRGSSGDYVFAPRDIPHRFVVGDRGCRMLFITVPGGLKDLVRATSRPAESRSLPSGAEPEPTAEQVEQLKAVVREHGCEVLL